MAGLERLGDAAREEHLAILGAFHPDASDGCPEGTGTLVLLGPAEPGFWAYVNAAPEFSDDMPDPLDRWSERSMSALAESFGAQPLFPFGGPPWRPFIHWALRSGRSWSSPVHLLVHEDAGLLVSWRGALALRERLELPPVPARSPCATCTDRPCLTSCPVEAMAGTAYDVPRCHAFLETRRGHDCMSHGCAVRRACPVSQSYSRLGAQSAYHMRQFHPGTEALSGRESG